MSLAFLPGGRQFLVGSKAGTINIFSTDSMQLMKMIQAHGEDCASNQRSIWTIDINRNMKSMISAGGDKQLKFWEFHELDDVGNDTVDILHTRTLKMNEEIICAKFSNSLSPKKQMVSLALMDNTVKVFDQQSLKFRLSLYGHKLPVMAMDISDDDTILVTGT